MRLFVHGLAAMSRALRRTESVPSDAYHPVHARSNLALLQRVANITGEVLLWGTTLCLRGKWACTTKSVEGNCL